MSVNVSVWWNSPWEGVLTPDSSTGLAELHSGRERKMES